MGGLEMESFQRKKGIIAVGQKKKKKKIQDYEEMNQDRSLIIWFRSK